MNVVLLLLMNRGYCLGDIVLKSAVVTTLWRNGAAACIAGSVVVWFDCVALAFVPEVRAEADVGSGPLFLSFHN